MISFYELNIYGYEMIWYDNNEMISKINRSNYLRAYCEPATTKNIRWLSSWTSLLQLTVQT